MLNLFLQQGLIMANQRVKIEIGKKYGRLIVQEETTIGEQGHIRYICKCDCGNSIATTGSRLRDGLVQSCGCLRKEHTKTMGKNRKGTSHLDDGQAGLNHLYNQYKHGAKRRDLEFNLTKEDVKELSIKNCCYCGQTPSQVINKESEKGKYIYNGIDRVDNKLGYSIDNCVPCCKICNRAKDVMTLDEFYTWVNKVFEMRFK